MITDWIVASSDVAQASVLSSHLGVPPAIATVLLRNGVSEPAAAKAFLTAALSAMPDPATLKDATRAADRLIAARLGGERVTIYGDYDVDGVTSTALLRTFFADELGFEVGVYIPHRLREGYGLNTDAIRRLAESGTRLLVTVDNGSSAIEEITLAQALGVDVIIIDHHQVSSPEPPAFAHLNPHRPGCTYSDKGLAAVGVAFVLLVELRRRLRATGAFSGRPEPRLERYLDFVALGTVADVAPLQGVNRAFVREGLETIRRTPRIGLAALLKRARITDINARDLGYKLGPRVNAAGRLDDATRGLTLLTTRDPSEAEKLAGLIEAQNDERRDLEVQMTERAHELCAAQDAELQACHILVDESFHPGVVGIVAARVVERTGRPTFCLAREGDLLKGSGRSVPGFDLKRALDACAHLLLRYGGHPAAAGVSLHRRELAAFVEAFDAVAATHERVLDEGPKVADLEVELIHLDARFLNEFERLGPFGHGSPSPLISISGLRGRARLFGEGHLRVEVAGTDVPIEVLCFGGAAHLAAFETDVDVLVTLERDRFRGRDKAVLRLMGLRPASRRP
ncbi:MAG: single-stranded-DNA-specific exonuclease RecJ [Myxococcales bacterium]|nr:single-stranded-DNA-specific exonuclease RecJ [Myxococcales bacterium]